MPTAELLRARGDPRPRGLRLPRGLGRRRLRQRGPARRGEPLGADPGAQGAVKTPLGLALRGRFLVGSRPVDGEFVRRFVASAAENGIDVFRLHDPLNDVSNLREAAEAIAAAGARVRGRARLQPRPDRRDASRSSSRRGSCPSSAPRACCSTTRPASLEPHRGAASSCAAARGERPAGRRLLPGVRRQRARCGARGGARRRRSVACAIYPVALTLHRVSGEALAEALAGLGLDTGVDVAGALGGVGDRRRAHRRRAGRRRSRRASPSVPPSTTCPRGSSPRSTRASARRPPATGSTRCSRSSADPRRGRLAAARRADRPDPRLAGAAQRALGAALPHGRRRAARARSRPWGTPPGADRPGRRAARWSCVADAALRRSRSDARGRARAGRGARLERGGAAPARALRRGGRAAAAGDPRARRAARTRSRRRRRPVARGADPRDRPHRPGVRRRRGDDRGGGDARVGAPDARSRAASRRRRRRRASRSSSRAVGRPRERPRARRVADGRHLLPRARSRARRRSSRRATPSRRARRSASSRR